MGLFLAALACLGVEAAVAVNSKNGVTMHCIGGQTLMRCGQALVSEENDQVCQSCCSEHLSNFTHYAKGNWGLTAKRYGLQCCCGTKSSGPTYKERLDHSPAQLVPEGA